MELRNRKVLITGAASGIGFCVAKEFADAGCELILTDINATALEPSADKLRKHGATVHTRVMDVSVREQVEALAGWVNETLGGLDILILNAGIGHNGELAETGLDKWKRLMDVNFWGPLYHVYAFLPSFIQRREGHIVTVSSGQAFFRLPTWGAYATIKLALGGFSEMLQVELRKYNIKVTTVYPFMVNTGFYQGIEGDTLAAKLSMKLVPYYSMKPETVGHIIFDAVKHSKRVEMVSILNDLAYFSRLIPPVANVISLAANRLLSKGVAHLPTAH